MTWLIKIEQIICKTKAAGQLRPLRHHIYRGAVVGVRGAAVGPGAQLSGPGAQLAVGNIDMHTYIRHICAPVHVRKILQQYIYMSQTAGYSIRI